jgi:hypothetical protein
MGQGMSSGQDGGFLGRWARRKREAEREAAAAPPEVAAEPAPDVLPGAAPAPAAEPEADPELLASLPRLEDITAATDIKVFLQKGVPAALRNAALRRAWSADPIISTYEDPARDYFWDWNAPGGVPGGGGLLDPERVAKMARDIGGKPDSEMDDSEPAPVDTAAAPAEDVAEEAPESPPPTPPEEAAPPPPAPPTAQASTKLEPPAIPRRRHGGALPL